MADLSIIMDILAAAANLETVAGNSDGSEMDELAATSIRGRAARLRAFAHELEVELRPERREPIARTVSQRGFVARSRQFQPVDPPKEAK